MSKLKKVTISLKRYDELVDLETRVNVAVERIIHDEFVRMEEILWILGTESAVEKAEILRKEAEECLKNMQKLE